jgi:hypothetical protein
MGRKPIFDKPMPAAERMRRMRERRRAEDAAKHPKPEPKAEVVEGIEIAALRRQLDQANAEIRELKRKLASAQEQARARAASSQADALADPATLSPSAKARFNATLAAHKKKLDSEFNARVHSGVVERLNEVLPEYDDKHREYLEVIRARRGVMPLEVFNLIRSCLHSDSRNSASDRRLNNAFVTFNKYERLLVAEVEKPTTGSMPRTYEDLVREKQKYQEERKAKRRDAKGTKANVTRSK